MINSNSELSSLRLSNINIHGGLIFGYNTGVIAAVLTVKEWSGMNEIDKGFLTCSILLGAMIGSLLAGFVTERVGRKKPMYILAVLSIVGALGSAFVPHGLWIVIPFRLILGIAVGSSGIVCPLYVGEMASPERKGTLGTVFQIAITVGILVGDVIGFSLKNVVYSYRIMFGLGAIPGVFLIATLFFVPESNVWIEKRNTQRNTLLLLNKDETGGMGIKLLLSKPAGRFALFIGSILAINNQLTGINAFMYFSPSIFQQAGISGNGITIATICLVGWNVISTLAATFLIDRIGRKKLMVISTVGMSISCLTLALLFTLVKGTVLGYLSVVLLFVFVFAFELGAGPLFWILVIEIFPEEMKDLGSSLLNALQWIFNIALSFSFLWLVSLIGQAAIFWIFGGIGIFCLVLVSIYLPDTQVVNQGYKPID
ncbi:hypothetical protein DFA_03636 [Cavenderia fasciculata]|uniref:Major facilitator superfamily (MFS) profile domain-containing protein n=1 Tax=Cavenderia fasciculata TaxID=261658 RepID=F4PIF8_CACFS|nr:uncharacterized protein DFA_03636 [Cavenderia fasciculata]EGG25387.1 hypothetical protein DFA_03636 [Cavenderia fasciculata]|eukprot:XP_004363238.1 hypothetical protein DFA_03636 [Cavenderia fasciculata]